MEIWAIDKKWNTLRTFSSFSEADTWWEETTQPKFQILYRTTRDYPIIVYKSND